MNQHVLCKILFTKKKKKNQNQNQTNVNVFCKPEEILSRQKKKKEKKNISKYKR